MTNQEIIDKIVKGQRMIHRGKRITKAELRKKVKAAVKQEVGTGITVWFQIAYLVYQIMKELWKPEWKTYSQF